MSLDLNKIKVIDTAKSSTSIVVYRIHDPVAASLEVQNVVNTVSAGEAVLKQIAAVSLRDERR